MANPNLGNYADLLKDPAMMAKLQAMVGGQNSAPPPMPAAAPQALTAPPLPDAQSNPGVLSPNNSTPPKPGFWSAMSNALGGGKPGDTAANLVPSSAAVGSYIGGIPGRLGEAFKENFSQAPIGPGVNIISKLLFGKAGDIYNNDLTQPAGSPAADTAPKPVATQKVYNSDLSADSQHDFIPHNPAAATAVTNDVTSVQNQIEHLTQQRNALMQAAAYSPQAKARVDYFNGAIKALNEQLSQQLDTNQKAVKASTRFGNFESDSDTAKAADSMGEAVGAMKSYIYKAKKAASEGDIQAFESVMNLMPSLLKKLSGARASAQENSSFSSAYDEMESAVDHLSAFSINPAGQRIFIPANAESQFKTASALLDETDKEFNRIADKAGATKEQRDLYRNAGTQVDDAVPVIVDNNGQPKVNPETKKLIEPIVVGFDKEGRPVYGDPTTGEASKVTTISKEYDPDEFMSDIKKSASKNAVFNQHELSMLAQNAQRQNALRAFTAGQSTGQNLKSLGSGLLDAATDMLPSPKGGQITERYPIMANPNNPVNSNAPAGPVASPKPKQQSAPMDKTTKDAITQAKAGDIGAQKYLQKRGIKY